MAFEAFRRGAAFQFEKLHRPVVEAEDFRFGQGAALAEAIPHAGSDAVGVEGNFRQGRVVFDSGSGRDGSNAGMDHHFRVVSVGRKPLGKKVALALEVILIVLPVTVDARGGIGVVQGERFRPDVEHVVGGGRTCGDDGFEIRAPGNFGQPGIHFEDLFFSQLAPEKEEQSAKFGIVHFTRRGNGGRFFLAGGEIVFRAGHGIEGFLEALFGIVVPDHQPVMREHDAFGILEARDQFRKLEAGPDPFDIRESFAQRLAHGFAAPGVIGQRANRIRMHMVDVRGGQEGVEQGFDRRTARGGVHQSAGHEGHHFVVVEIFKFGERHEFVQIQRRVVAGTREFQIGAGSLDPHHAPLAAEVVCDLALAGGVATAEEHEVFVAADAPGPRHQFREGLFFTHRDSPLEIS